MPYPFLDYVFKTFFPVGWDKDGSTIEILAEAIIKETDPRIVEENIIILENILNDHSELVSFIAECRGFIFKAHSSLEEEKIYLQKLIDSLKVYILNFNDYPWISCVFDSDNKAGHPEDPDRFSNGVDDESITEDLIATCKLATDLYPHIPRLWFQLGRSLWLNGYYEEALNALNESAEMGHAGAMGYLGDAYGFGIHEIVERDINLAYSFYLKSAELGFAPAQKAVEEIEFHARELPAEEEQFFHYPKVLEECAKGNFLILNEDLGGINFIIYLSRALDGMGAYCPQLNEEDFIKKHHEKDIVFNFAPVENHPELFDRMYEGDLTELCQIGVDDGYSYAVSLGCSNKKLLECVRNIIAFLTPDSAEYEKNSKTIN